MEYDCPHNPGGVVCHNMARCAECGWYPPEEKRRLEMIRDGKMKKSLSDKTRLWIKKKSRPSGANAESGKAK